MNETWLIVRVPGGTYVWDLGHPDPAELDDAVLRARVFAGFPATDTWMHDSATVDQFVAPGIPPRQTPTTSLAVTFGEPHANLLAAATVGPDLSKVPAKALDDYRAEYAANTHQAQVDSAVTSLAGLHPDALVAVLAHPDLARP
jgi:hypothetical protein